MSNSPSDPPTLTARKIFIAVPAFGLSNTTETTMALMQLAQALGRVGIGYYFAVQTFPDVGELRNMLLTLWYDRLTDAAHMLMVDADMGFEAQLVLDMLALDEPLVGCLYPKKTYPLSLVGRPLPGTTASLRGGFMEMEGIGFGVTLIRRDCVTTMLDRSQAISDQRLATHTAGPMLKEWGVTRIIRAFDPVETDSGRLSEDISFCVRHRACGGRVWAAINHRITHVGPHGYAMRPADALRAQKVSSAAAPTS